MIIRNRLFLVGEIVERLEAVDEVFCVLPQRFLGSLLTLARNKFRYSLVRKIATIK